MWALRQRAERAEAERDLRIGKAQSDERARIAREMHDVLAHRISQVSMHAGALSFRTDLDADGDAGRHRRRARQGQRGAHRPAQCPRGAPRPCVGRDHPPAPADLRRRPGAGRPGAGRRARGSSSTSRVAGGPVPPRLGRTLYRIVQEGITNAAQARPGCAAHGDHRRQPRRRRRGGPAEPARPRPAGRPGAGLGLVGLVERVELAGGRLRPRPRRRDPSSCGRRCRGPRERGADAGPRARRRRRPAGPLGARR